MELTTSKFDMNIYYNTKVLKQDLRFAKYMTKLIKKHALARFPAISLFSEDSS
jgi:hypothetical protein